jgi:glycosyltransferase involved in cell wall biosynthesis
MEGSDKIHVLYAIPNLNIGGAEKHLFQLIKGLDKQQFLPSIVCSQKLGPLVGPVEESGATVQEHQFLNSPHPWRLLSTIRFLKRVKPHILHSYLYHGDLWLALAAKLAGVPFLILSRRNLGHWRHKKPSLMDGLAGRFADLVVANSQSAGQVAVEHERVPRAKLRIIAGGIDLGSYAVRPGDSILSANAAIGMVANFSLVKGHVTLIKSIPLILESYPNAKFVLVGEGGQRLHIESLCRELGVSESVTFAGQVLDVRSYLERFDVFVLTSFAEGASNALLEAMATGLPVVVTEVGGNKEAVIDGQNGLLVPPGDPAALAGAILGLLKNPEMARQMGRCGRARIEQEFSLTSMIKQFQATYLESCDRKAG